MKKIFFGFLAFAFLSNSTPALSSVLSIKNNTGRDIRNILVLPANDREPFFFRLDLTPNGIAKVENPDCEASLRVDDGINFLIFDHVNLHSLSSLSIQDDPVSLEVITIKNDKSKISGRLSPLLPQKGDKPVCELSRFHPKMSMSEVCGILPSETPKDDNGAMLSGIGYAGLVWAGRLAPETAPANPEDPLLEHMELERPFSHSDIDRVLKHLFKEGYVPWQVEFPRADLDFADMPDQNQQDRNKELEKALNIYLHEKLPENAIIMLAPQASLKTLANADNPEADAQLFTLLLRPRANKIILDIAAYEAGKP